MKTKILLLLAFSFIGSLVYAQEKTFQAITEGVEGALCSYLTNYLSFGAI